MPPLKVSIAMCTYNGAQYLPAQLQSLAAQDRLPDELVICDDKSDDATVSIAHDFARTVSFPVRIICKPKTLGSSKNFERAIEACQETIIALSDQDDVWLPGKLAALASVFEREPDVDLVFSDATVVDADLNSLGYSLWKSIRFSARERQMVRQGRSFEALLRHNVVTGATMAFRSSMRSLVLPIPDWSVHDGWIALLTSIVGSVQLIDEPLTLYRQHASNQIGGRQRDLTYRLRRPVGDALRETKRVLMETEALGIRIQERGYSATHREYLGALALKQRHLLARDHYATRAPGSIMEFVGEILRGRYHRYSMGWPSVFHDLYKRRRELG